MLLNYNLNVNIEKRLSVIIPVYNEEDTVLGIVERVLARPETGEISLSMTPPKTTPVKNSRP